MSASLRRATAIALIVSLLISGCTRIVDHRVANYSPGLPPTTGPAPQTAIYSVKILDAKGKKVGSIAGSRTFLKKGEPIGFAIDDSGSLRAVAGTYNFPIEVPDNHSLIWSARYRISTQFGREVGKVSDTTLDTTATVLLVVGVLAIISGAAYAWYRQNFTHDRKLNSAD